MSRLVTFGCSLTYGTALPDCWIDNCKSGKFPSKYAWPQLLADKLGVECDNRSYGGLSNKEIHNRILTTDLDENDIVVVLWTYNNRWSVNTSRNRVTCVVPFHATTELNELPWKYTEFDIEKKKLATAYYGYVHNEYDIRNDFNHRLDHAYLHLNRISAKQYHFMVENELRKHVDWTRNGFMNDRIIFGKIGKKFSRALDGQHPGVDAHIAFADELYRLLQNT